MKKDYISKRNKAWDLVIYLVFYDCNPKYGTHQTWGHKRIAGFLNIGRKLVLNAIKDMNLVPLKCKRSYYWKQYTKEKTQLINAAPNLIKNTEEEVDFSVTKPLEKICLEISEFKHKHIKWYLFAFIDVFSRCPLVCYWSKDQTVKSLSKALMRLYRDYNINGTILHTDSGVQFRSYFYWEFAQKTGMILSMTDGYASWQNSIVESFFKSIKRDYFYENTYANDKDFITKMKDGIWNYINVRYHTIIKTTPKLKFECGTI